MANGACVDTSSFIFGSANVSKKSLGNRVKTFGIENFQLFPFRCTWVCAYNPIILGIIWAFCFIWLKLKG